MDRLFPELDLVELDTSHPVFHSFFNIEDLDFNDPRLQWIQTRIYGVFEDNDPSKRLLMVVNYNMDIGDYWEWSDTGFYPINLTERGFKLGVNYVMYGSHRLSSPHCSSGQQQLLESEDSNG